MSLGFGGIERLVYDLVSEQKIYSEIKPSVGIAKLKGEFKTEFDALDVPLINLNLNSGYDFNPLKINRIRKVFKQQDIVHLHGFHLSVAVAALLSRTKLIYTEHGNFGFGRNHTRSDKFSFLFRRLFFRWSSVNICCNSNFTKWYLKKHFYDGPRSITVHNGVSFNKKIKSGIVDVLKSEYSDSFVIGTTTRLAGFKRIDRLIEVFAAFLKVHKNAILMIVGDGPKKEQLMEKTNALNIASKVVFEGFQQEVTSYQSFFDVAIFPSQNEPFGLVAVECLKLQKPVLVFKDGGGICEIIDRFTPEDVCEDYNVMLDRLLYYSKNKYEWSDEKSAELDYFSVSRMERMYFNQYKSIL
ncbi:glycosyltransferase family 4 protein [Winogradskyella sp. KYW1333]|uniref:glycosyltransferase family 4 protein n=1 Tax=Winogradskyella sp. KYW1333 TaxID=2282123 RepID=UPI0015F02D2B|nr:glycosyltransferase family 4 protein [Winogradskyella sp. KYW1333]